MILFCVGYLFFNLLISCSLSLTLMNDLTHLLCDLLTQISGNVYMKWSLQFDIRTHRLIFGEFRARIMDQLPGHVSPFVFACEHPWRPITFHTSSYDLSRGTGAMDF